MLSTNCFRWLLEDHIQEGRDKDQEMVCMLYQITSIDFEASSMSNTTLSWKSGIWFKRIEYPREYSNVFQKIYARG